MQVINSENNVFIDVDNTIASWFEPTLPGHGKISISFAGETVYLTPHNYHIQLVKMYKARGYTTFVWSANGVAHAKQVVEKLGLPDYVDFVLTKPCKHMDDSEDAASILGPRVFIDDLTKPVPILIPAGATLDTEMGVFFLP